MGGLKVAIIGSGSMGALLAARIPTNYRKVIISRQREVASTLADEVGGVAADHVSAVRGCSVVLLAVPGHAVPQVLRDASPHLAEGALVVNMAPDLVTADLAAEFPRLSVAAAKIIGHAAEMRHGTGGVVVLDHVEGEWEDRLRSMLDGLGTVLRGRESLALEANIAVAEAMLQAQTALLAQLQALGLERHTAQAAIAGSAPGVILSLALGEPGPFVQGVINKVRGGAPADHAASH